jgi:hypothetical protein
MNLDKIQSILAAEIECGVFEQHVLPALAACRQVAADECDPDAYMVRHKDFRDSENLWRCIEITLADKYKADDRYDMRPLYASPVVTEA